MGETTGGVLQRGPDRVVAGVCSGLGAYFHLETTLVRVLFVILALIPLGLGIVVYVVLWFLMEPAGAVPMVGGRTVADRARDIGQDLRQVFRGGPWRTATPPSGTPGPPPAGPAPTPSGAAPSPPPNGGWSRRAFGGRPRGLWAGIILIALGAYFLLANLGVLEGFRWDVFWPVVLIAIGLLVLLRRMR